MSAFARLEGRERLLVVGVLPLALLAALWTLAYRPLDERREETRRRIADYRAITIAATRLAPVDGTAPVPSAPDTAAPERSIAARVTLAAEGAGLPLSRLEPDGEQLRLVLQDVAFPILIEWLHDLEATHSVRLVAIEADRRVAPGTVSVSMTLEDA